MNFFYYKKYPTLTSFPIRQITYMLQFHEIFEIFSEIATLEFKFHEIFVKIIIRVAISRNFFAKILNGIIM